MWKIATLMLTTAVLAGLLIANPSGLLSADAARPTTVTRLQVQSAPNPAQPKQDNQIVAGGQPTPAPDQSAVEQVQRLLVAVAPTRPVHVNVRRMPVNRLAHRSIRTAGRTTVRPTRHRTIV